MKKECFICKNSKIEFLLKKDSYNLWHCRKCKLNFIHPQPTEKELQKVYSLKGGYSHSDKGFDKENISSTKNSRVEFLVKNNKKKVLDVGCASGAFVYAAKLAKLNPIGIDLDKDSIQFGIKEGLALRHGTLHDMKFKKNSFDAINLSHVLEHVKDPENLIKECFSVLNKRGILMVSLPNTNAFSPSATRWVYEKTGIMWAHPTPPHHLFDFSDKNLTKLLKKNKFDVKKIEYSQTPVMYSIYHTGYFNELRKNMTGVSKKEVLGGLIKSFNMKIFKQAVVSFIYGFVFIVEKLFDKKGNRMTIYCTKG